MLPIISWKNVWRNKTRSLVVIVAMMIGVFSGTFIIALATGVVDGRSRSVVENETSHIQIHHPKFTEYQELQYFITDVDEKLDSIKALAGVKAVSSKYKTMVIAKTANKTGGMFVNGIDPELDTSVFKVYENLRGEESSYIDNDSKGKIILSESLAKNLLMEYYQIDSIDVENIKASTLPLHVQNEVISLEGKKFKKRSKFTSELKKLLNEQDYFLYKNKILRICDKYKIKKRLETTIYSYKNINKVRTYKVAGYYKTNDAMFDGMNAFITKEDFRKQADMPKNSAHEIDILLGSKDSLLIVKGELERMFPDLKVESYRDIKPEVAMSEAMMKLYTFIIMGIILFALAFGIINTMLMAVLERTKEIGMLKAIGMNRKRVFFMIMYETVYLGLVGGIVGMVIGFFTITSLSKNGINLAIFQEGFEAMGYSSILYPKLEPVFFIQVTLLVVVAGVLSAIIPARRALKLNPADAVRLDV